MSLEIVITSYYQITEVFESVLSIQQHARNVTGWPGSKHDIQIQKHPPEVFCKKGVLRNFAKFTGKTLCHNLFLNKVAGLRPATLLKRRLWHRRFPVKNTFFTEHLRTTASADWKVKCTLLLKLNRNFLHLWRTFYRYFLDIYKKMGEKRPLLERSGCTVDLYN